MNAPTGHIRFGARKQLPVILQTQYTECGLACLAMIATWHGHELDLPALRRRFAFSLRGANLSRLVAIAQDLGLQGRGLKLELGSLRDLKLPCILHWNLNHFVVLKRITSRHIEIHDPACGARRLSWAEASKHFTGIALELTRRADFTPIKDRQRVSLGRLTGQTYGLRRGVAQILALALALETFALIAPFHLQWVLDHVLVSSDYSLLTMLGTGFLLVVLMQALLTAARGWAISALGASFAAQWATNLFGHLLRLPLDYFAKRHIGDVNSRLLSVRSIQETLSGAFFESVLDGFAASLMLAVLYIYNAALMTLALAAIGAYALVRWLGYARLRTLKEEQLTQLARQQTEMFESIHGVQTIKLSNKQEERRIRFANVTAEVAHREVAIQRIGFSFTSLGQLVFGVQRVLVVWIAAWFVLENRMSAGMLVVCMMYSEQFSTRMRALIDKLVEFRLLQVHAERIADIALSEPEADVESAYAGPPPEPRIDVRGLSFRYGDGEPWVLHDCSLSIAAGESVAIVGPSGCGKTTLAKLILGLLTPSEGRIEIGGIDIRRYGLGAYRSEFGAVMQEDELFSGSLADNISFFDPNAENERIHRAAEIANIAEDIGAMPMRYETPVGDMGSSLSGGQKQRILLARALYREPRVLLLDEATSHLDVSRERRINGEIAQLAITRIIIAHRPETIASADRVIHLIDGQVRQVSALEYRQARPPDDKERAALP